MPFVLAILTNSPCFGRGGQTGLKSPKPFHKGSALRIGDPVVRLMAGLWDGDEITLG